MEVTEVGQIPLSRTNIPTFFCLEHDIEAAQHRIGYNSALCPVRCTIMLQLGPAQCLS